MTRKNTDHRSTLIIGLLVLLSISSISSSHATELTTSNRANQGSLYLVKVTGTSAPLSIEGVLPGTRPWAINGVAEYTIITGDGGPITVVGTGQTGKLSIQDFELSPNPPKVGSALDSLKVPVVGTLVTSKFVTKKGTLYLISASGEGTVGFGPGGVGRPGDAEYMDYSPDGDGNTDIGDRGVDYGVGVDDTDVNKAPRHYKWGPWRADHTYFLVFTGTGKTVDYLYYDSNYLDNSPTDALTVKIYAVP